MEATISGYSFSGYYLDLVQKTLIRDDEVIPLPERNFRLLHLLAQHSPEPVSKDLLFEQLWENTVVSDWALFRLVSDTRQLMGEDGEDPNVLKTARGKGFFLTACEPVFDHQRSGQALKSGGIRTGIGAILAAIVVIAGLFWAVPEYQEAKLVAAVEVISELQDNTYTMFLAQVTRRNELVAMIEQRTGQKRDREFEKFFSMHFPNMTEQELFVFAQIRAMTEKGLYEYNSQILQTLNENPELYDEIEMSFDLQQHLEFWLKKYHNLFVSRPDMCLLYVGVEDGVPYPSGVDKKVKDWLAMRSENNANE